MIKMVMEWVIYKELLKITLSRNVRIDMIWLNPIYPSPQKDNGYDISNYIAIDPVFGTEDDFKELVKKHVNEI